MLEIRTYLNIPFSPLYIEGRLSTITLVSKAYVGHFVMGPKCAHPHCALSLQAVIMHVMAKILVYVHTGKRNSLDDT